MASAVIFGLDRVAFAVGFSVGWDGNGEPGRLPLTDVLFDGRGGDTEGGKDDGVGGGGDVAEAGGGVVVGGRGGAAAGGGGNGGGGECLGEGECLGG